MSFDSQQMPIAQLIQNFRRGLGGRDELIALAKEWLRQRVDGEIYGLLRARLDDSDVAQEAVIKVIEGLDTFEGNTEADFRAWVNSIGRNKLNDVLRGEIADKCNPEREIRLDATPADSNALNQHPPGQDTTPSQVAIQNELKERALEAMDKLSPSHREVICLRGADEMKWEEIGCKMGCSADAAKHLYQRAIKELRRHLGKNEQ